jgi:hypothetical protein
MTIKKEFKTAKDFREFIAQNCSDPDKMFVKEVYNLGDTQPEESPLFIYSGYSIIMIYLSDGVLSLNVYDKDFFIQHIRGGIFREEPDSEEFYYVYFPDSKLIGSFIQNMDVKENEDGTIGKVELIFKDGRHLNVEHSDLIEETMNSYITD